MSSFLLSHHLYISAYLSVYIVVIMAGNGIPTYHKPASNKLIAEALAPPAEFEDAALAQQYGGSHSGGWVGRLPASWVPYVQLARLSPPAALFLIYFPPHLKYVTVDVDMHDNRPPHLIKSTEKTYEWWLSVILAWVVLLYTCVPQCATSTQNLTSA